MNLLELVLEVEEHIDFIKRDVLDSKEEIIAYLTKQGIEAAMDWSNWGVIFIQKYVDNKFEDYNNKHKPSNFICLL